MPNVTDRIQALVNHTGFTHEEIKNNLPSDDTTFTAGSEEYLVLTDEEAQQWAIDAIKRDIWAFKIEFLLAHMSWTDDEHLNMDALQRSIEQMQQTMCEDASPILLRLIDDADEFARDAINCDGRGHFLSPYDGEENEVEVGDETYYIYRMN